MASLDATPEPEGFDLKVEVPGGAISTLASTCASNFYNTLQILSEDKDKKYEGIFRKFEKRFLDWAAYLGVFAGGNASLDHRLERHPQYRDLVLLVLDILNVSLVQTTTEPSEPSSDESSDDEVDRWKIEAESIQRSINELDRLAIHIRQSSTSSLDARVKAFGARKPSEVSSYETKATIAVSCLYPEASDSLRRHLSKSMTQRHTKLLYWQSHDKKLRVDRRRDKQRQDDPIQTPREPSPLPTKAPSLPRQSARDEDPVPPMPGESRFSAGSSFLSGTRASELGSRFTIPPAEAKIPARKRAGASTVLQTGAKFPSPPKFEDGEDQKPCPLCRKIFLKDDFTDNKWWRSHVNDDLMPFVCVSSTCMGSRTFASRTAWKGHTGQYHDGMWLQSLKVDSQNLSDTVNVMDICPICCLPLAEFTNLKPNILQAPESETSPPKARTPSGNKSVSKTVRFDVSGPKILVTADIETLTGAESSMMLDHIADHLQFLALLTPRLSTEKLREGDTHTFSSDQGLSSDQGSGKRSTLDDDFAFVADEAQDADMDAPLDEAPQTEAITDQAWQEDEEIELVEAMDWSIVTTLNPSNEGDDKIEHMQRVRAECDNLLEAALESSVEGRHYRRLFLETAAASCKSITTEMLMSLESEIAVGAFINSFAREIPRDALHGFLEKALTSIDSGKDFMLVDYCTEQVWDFRPHQDPHAPTEERFASRRVLFGLLAMLDRPLDILRAIKDNISDLSIPLAKMALTQLFPTWTGTEVSSFMRFQRDVQPKLESTPHPFASIPFRRDPTFVDRGDILNRIDLQCSEPASRVAIVGLGGIGKSQLAIEFAHRFAARSADAWVFWVHASTQARIIEGFKSIANNVKVIDRNRPDADVLHLVFDWLSNIRNGKWLLVLDSADDSDVSLHSTSGDNDNGRKLVEYLPQSPNGSIIITTRSWDLAFRLTGTSQTIHEIGPMTQEEALMLLENRLGTLSDANAAADLVKLLDLVPLTITQAAAYIQMRAPRTSLVQYLNEFRQSESKRVKLLSHDAGDLRRDLRQDGGASNAILTTWQVSFDHIRSRRPSAADLLSLMSFFNRQRIPKSLLRPSKDSYNAAQSINPEDMTDLDSQGSDNEAENEFEDDIAMLQDYCFIMQGEDANTFEMHGLVQLSTRRWLKDQGLLDMFLEKYITVMASAFPTGEYKNWTRCQPLFAHVEAAAEYRPNDDNLQRIWSGLLHNGGWYALLQGRYAVAEQMLSRGRRTREKLLGNDHEVTLASTLLLASTYSNQGRWEEAEKLGVQVMGTYKAKLGADHPDTLMSINNLALTYSNQGRWKQAEELQIEVLEARMVKLGGDHPDTLTIMDNLALTYSNQGRLEEAEELQIRVMEARKVKLGEDHPDTLTIMNNLALTYSNQGRREEAEKLQIQALETRMVKLGGDHPDTLASMNNLAVTWKNQGRWEEALSMMESCVQRRRQVLGLSHPLTKASLSTLDQWTNN